MVALAHNRFRMRGDGFEIPERVFSKGNHIFLYIPKDCQAGTFCLLEEIEGFADEEIGYFPEPHAFLVKRAFHAQVEVCYD
jgi:hypothetical protein